MAPRLICKSGYITDHQYFANLLEYAGNKLAAQQVVYRDGSTREVDIEKKIILSRAEQNEVLGVQLSFKDGGAVTITYDQYHSKTFETQQTIRSSDVVVAQDDAAVWDTRQGPHEMKDLDFFKYLGYIEGRQGVAKEDGHGLFGLGGNIPIGEAKQLAEKHEDSRKWSHIISMDTQDAQRTGFDNRAMWQNLVVSKAPEIAKAYNISLNNLVINCAYHDNTDNPHVHLMYYSKDATEGFIKGGTEGMNAATEKLKSTLVNEIFKGETADLGKEKSALRGQMMEQLKAHLSAVEKTAVGSELLERLEALSLRLENISGKKVYEYLPVDIKKEVDELVQQAVLGTPVLNKVFNEYLSSQQKLIARYVSTPERMSEKLSEFQDSFFHPKKYELRQHHNIVIAAATELAAHRAAALRTFGEEVAEDSTTDLPLSSDNLEAAPDAPRTFGEEMAEDSTAGLSLSSDDFEVLHDELPTSGEEIADYVASAADLSSEKNRHLSSAGEQLSAKVFSAAFRTSMRNIFNPKVPNTRLQDSAIAQLEELRQWQQLPSSADVGKKEHCREARQKLFALLKTDDVYSAWVESVLQSAQDSLCTAFNHHEVNRDMDRVRDKLLDGSSIYLSGMDKYAAQLDDQRYYQLLEAYGELGKPLNKAIRKTLQEEVPTNKEVQEWLRNISVVADYINDETCQEYIKSQVYNLLSDLKQVEVYQDAESAYKKIFANVLQKQMPDGLGVKYHARFCNTYDNVKRIMRPHYTIVQSARELDNILCDHAMRSEDIQQPLKKLLRQEMDACLADTDSFSAQWVRLQLERIRQSDSPDEAACVLTYLYQTSAPFRQLLDNHIGALHQRLKTVVSSDVAADYCAAYRDKLLHGSFLPLHGSVGWYAQQLDENYYRILSQKYKTTCFQTLYSDVCKGLWNSLSRPETVSLLKDLKTTLQLAESTDVPEVQATVREIYRQVVGEDKVDAYTETIAMSFRDVIAGEVDANLTLTLYERVRLDVYTGELPVADFIIRNFAKDMDKNIAAAYLKKCLKHTAVKMFRSELYHAANKAYTGDAPCKERLLVLATHTHDRKNFNEILQLLSFEVGTDFLAKKAALYNELYLPYQANTPEPISRDEFAKVVDSFVYGEDGNTFFFQEPIESMGQQGAIAFPTVLVAKAMLKAMVSCIAAANAARSHGHDNEKHTFAKHRQFNNLKFPKTQNFAEY